MASLCVYYQSIGQSDNIVNGTTMTQYTVHTDTWTHPPLHWDNCVKLVHNGSMAGNKHHLDQNNTQAFPNVFANMSLY